MTTGQKPHPIETSVEWLAAAALASATCWSVWALTALPVAAVAGAIVTAIVSKLILAAIGRSSTQAIAAAFVPVAFEEATFADELLLDDPLISIDPDSRVVRLFERPDATPGELVTRISDFLGERAAPVSAQVPEYSPVDASAALHAALANIRASLR
ncbi:hypothetical protein [Sphingomonas edaphi]|uniref:Uncharacterized protein n=1 Tax=Sphingomonas edaphi TaxID=2315689 RepID=A0A418PZ94_9SPHN|nr:hypothetical protein [Sphingomonas edaphi]RIX27359.1 hypothetical protein D3M59_09950 [Sphingomonas edaphi]